jgi:hypothetical protein
MGSGIVLCSFVRLTGSGSLYLFVPVDFSDDFARLCPDRNLFGQSVMSSLSLRGLPYFARVARCCPNSQKHSGRAYARMFFT